MKGFAESQSVGEVALGILLGKVERRPHEGVGWSGGVGEGHRDTPMGKGTRETLGKGWEGGKVSQGCPQTGKVQKRQRPQEGGQGCHRELPPLGGCRRDPANGKNAGKSYQQGTPNREECRRDLI